MREIIDLLESKNRPQDLELVDVNYTTTSLQPVISSGSFKYHRELAQAYATRYNEGQGDPQFNYSGLILHNIWFTQFRQPRTKNDPNGPIGGLIRSKFGSYDDFKEKFSVEAMKLQGSGWIYLARDGTIKTIHNHAVKPDIVILIDMWEHSYVMDYGTNKKKYLENIWRIIDWNVINARYMQPYKKP